MASTDRLQVWVSLWTKLAWPIAVLIIIAWLRQPIFNAISTMPDVLARAQKVELAGLTVDVAQARGAALSMDSDVKVAIAKLTPYEFQIFMFTGGKNFVLSPKLVKTDVAAAQHLDSLGLAKFSIVSDDKTLAEARKASPGAGYGWYYLVPTDLGNRAWNEVVKGIAASITSASGTAGR